MKFTEMRRASWDTETTGVSVHEDRIVTAAFIVRTPGRDDVVLKWLINPGVPIPPETTKVHGIDDAKAQAEGVEPAVALDQLASHIVSALSFGMPLIAYNQSFDWSILHYELLRHGLPTVYERLGAEPVTLIDPVVLDKQMDRYVKGKNQRRLNPTCERYGITLENWHEAEADAMAALLIAEAQFERFARLRQALERGPVSLFADQQRWHAAHQGSLAAYFSGRGEHAEAASVRTEWPLIPAAAGEPEPEAVTAP